jgi:hypothetical protein
VIGDLLDMLTDHLNGREMTWMTKIVIALIVITSIVAAAEVYVKIVSIPYFVFCFHKLRRRMAKFCFMYYFLVFDTIASFA